MRWVGLIALVLVTGCGTQTSLPAAGSARSAPPSDDGRLRGWGTVLDDGDGPELCLGGVAESLPPQCGGPPVEGWDWSAVGHEDVGGTRWGSFVVTGTFDGTTFRLTDPPVSSDDYEGERPSSGDTRLGTPCPEPPGGWRPVDPGLTTEAALRDIGRHAESLDGFADLWLDQSVNPAYGTDDPQVMETELNDPEQLVVNVRVVGDPTVAEAALRTVWGGALCVTRAERTDAELEPIQMAMMEIEGVLGSSRGFDTVEVSVVHDDGSLQRRLDEEYGGVVRVSSALVPLNELDH